MASKIVVVGSSNTDMILKMSKIPNPGETIIGGEFTMAAGGKGANQAVAAARAGGAVTFIARVGDDMFGQNAVKGFIEDKIDVKYLFRDEQAPSGVALIFVGEDGENSIGVASGANANLTSEDVEKAEEAISSTDILVLQLEIPIVTVEKAAKIAYENEVTIILNPAPAQPLNGSLLKYISILTPNESEAELLTGVKVQNASDAEKAAKELIKAGVKTVLITMGSKGVFVASENIQEHIPAFKVTPVDTTAAGDVFNGALAVAIGEGKSLTDAIQFASSASAISVTRLGAQPSVPYREEIECFRKPYSIYQRRRNYF